MCMNFFVHTLLERGIHTHINSVLVLGKVRCTHAFRTRYTYVYSVLVLAVETQKFVVHTLLEQGIHIHIQRACFSRGEVHRAYAFRTR